MRMASSQSVSSVPPMPTISIVSPNVMLSIVSCDFECESDAGSGAGGLKGMRREVLAFGREMSEEEWVRGQMKFVGGHGYFTEEAAAIRNTIKQENLDKLSLKLMGI